MTNTLELIWCRTFQAVLKVGNYFMGYRMPHYLEGPGKIAELGSFYGCSAFAFQQAILDGGQHVLAAMDIGGAMSLKTNFKNVTTIYIKRDKKKLMASILRKNSSIEDKVNRLIAIESEKKNEEICDYVVKFEEYDDDVEQICQILGIE